MKRRIHKVRYGVVAITAGVVGLVVFWFWKGSAFMDYLKWMEAAESDEAKQAKLLFSGLLAFGMFVFALVIYGGAPSGQECEDRTREVAAKGALIAFLFLTLILALKGFSQR